MEKILKLLEDDATLTAEQIALMLSKEVGEIKDAIKKYEKDGVILGYKTLIDWDKTEREYVSAIIEVKVLPQRDRGFDKIAEKTGISKSEVYRHAIKEIGGVSTTVCVQDKAVDRLREGWEKNGIGWQTDTLKSRIDGCTNVILYYGSSVYTSQQMSRLIDSLVQEAEGLGIPTYPEEKEDD